MCSYLFLLQHYRWPCKIFGFLCLKRTSNWTEFITKLLKITHTVANAWGQKQNKMCRNEYKHTDISYNHTIIHTFVCWSLILATYRWQFLYIMSVVTRQLTYDGISGGFKRLLSIGDFVHESQVPLAVTNTSAVIQAGALNILQKRQQQRMRNTHTYTSR